MKVSNYDEPLRPCPYCKNDMMADWVDVGVGVVQCGPYHCMSCGASEIGPEMKYEVLKDENGNCAGIVKLLNPEDFTEEEIATGYYKGKVSPYANTVNGVLVDHITAKEAYDVGLLDEKNLKE